MLKKLDYKPSAEYQMLLKVLLLTIIRKANHRWLQLARRSRDRLFQRADPWSYQG